MYNSVGVVAQNYGMIPEGRGFGELNAENIAAILADNADKIVYLKIGDIVCDSPDAYGPRIQLRSFGLTYAYDASAANQGVQVADSANRADLSRTPAASTIGTISMYRAARQPAGCGRPKTTARRSSSSICPMPRPPLSPGSRARTMSAPSKSTPPRTAKPTGFLWRR